MSALHQIPAVPCAGAQNPLLEAALRYAERGWPTFPCEPRGKRPLTTHGLTDATTNVGQIRVWWHRWPDANVAVVTGAISGLLVLDVDGDVGLDSLRELERAHGRLPPTATVVTPGGGRHFYFEHVPGARNSAGRLGRGLDIRAEGGLVVVPPSVGASGRRYEPDERAPLAQAPPWLVELLTDPPSSAQRTPAGEWIALVRDGLDAGNRNEGLTRFIGHLLRRYVDVDLVGELAQLVNARFRPPLPTTEVDRIVESVAGLELRRRQRWAGA